MKSELNKLRVIPMLQLLALTATFASCVGQTAMADETKIFEWRDAKGVTSYWQNPPPQGIRGVTSLEVDTKNERAARDGRTPHAGERVGNTRAGSCLRSEYFDRQKRLEDAVQEARVSVDDAMNSPQLPPGAGCRVISDKGDIVLDVDTGMIASMKSVDSDKWGNLNDLNRDAFINPLPSTTASK